MGARNRFDPGRHQRCAALDPTDHHVVERHLDYRASLAVASITASDSVGCPLLDFVQLINNVQHHMLDPYWGPWLLLVGRQFDIKKQTLYLQIT